MQLFAKLPSGRTVPVNVQKDDKMRTLISQLMEIASSEVTRSSEIVFQGKKLSPNTSVDEAGFSKEDTIHVVSRKATVKSKSSKTKRSYAKREVSSESESEASDDSPARDIDLFVKLPSGRTVPVNIKDTATVQALKNKIASVAPECPSNRQKLAFAGRNLNNGRKLRACGLEQEATIHVLLVDPPKPTPTSTYHESVTVNEAELKDTLLESFAGSSRVQILFIFDTTGSMYGVLTEVRRKLDQTCARLIADIDDIEIAIMAMGDYCDQNSSYVLRYKDFSTDAKALCKFAQSVPSSGGGDADECYEWALKKAQDFAWRDDYSKAVVMIGDCNPHEIGYTTEAIFWYDEAIKLGDMGVQIYGVHAKPSSASKMFYSTIAEVTGGQYLTFNSFPLITDMFLAVCYRESSPQKLAEYKAEVKKEGRLDGELSQMITTLEEAKKEKKREDETRDRLLAHYGRPYNARYKLSGNKWVPCSGGSTTSYTPTKISTSASTSATSTSASTSTSATSTSASTSAASTSGSSPKTSPRKSMFGRMLSSFGWA